MVFSKLLHPGGTLPRSFLAHRWFSCKLNSNRHPNYTLPCHLPDMRSKLFYSIFIWPRRTCDLTAPQPSITQSYPILCDVLNHLMLSLPTFLHYPFRCSAFPHLIERLAPQQYNSSANIVTTRMILCLYIWKSTRNSTRSRLSLPCCNLPRFVIISIFTRSMPSPYERHSLNGCY